MTIEQIYTGCLAQGAYYIESQGEVAIIDPLREVQPYLDRVAKDKAKVKYIFETHFHADFVSGHLTLSKKHKRQCLWPKCQSRFRCDYCRRWSSFPLGEITILALHTPGHTMESTTYLLRDKMEKTTQYLVETLFFGRCRTA